MSFKRPALIALAACLPGVLAGAPLRASDISIGLGAATVSTVPAASIAEKRVGEKKKSTDAGRLKTDSSARMPDKRNSRRISEEKVKRRERIRPRQISAYSLFHEPLFKSHTAAIAPYRV